MKSNLKLSTPQTYWTISTAKRIIDHIRKKGTFVDPASRNVIVSLSKYKTISSQFSLLTQI